MVVDKDLYKELEIDRAWDGKTIRRYLNDQNKLWTGRECNTNDPEQRLLNQEILQKIQLAFKYLVKDSKRKEYDEALEKAYKDGKIVDYVEQQLQTTLEKAREYYRKGNINLATQYAQEAVDGSVNDPTAYDLLARCYYDANKYPESLSVIDKGIEIFKDNLDLHWLGARIATAGVKDFDNAQQRINTMLELAPENAIGHAEQIYLHLRKGDEELAFQEIDSYISSHPDDIAFKRGVAYDIEDYSNSCFYYDEAQNASFIADKKEYENCLRLRTKAKEIFSDEYTQKKLEQAEYFGQKEWNSWNIESIKSLSIYGAILLFLFPPVGIFLLAVDAMLIYFSFRPYWQINKTYVTGEMGQAERIVSSIGDISARFGGWFVRFIFKAAWIFIKFIIWVCSGGFFR